MEKSAHIPVFYQTGYRNGVKGVLTKAFCKFLKAGEQDVIYDTQMPKISKFPPLGTVPGPNGMSHYGIMISDLPAPHHFMVNMILIDCSGWKAWDDDSLLQSNATNTISIGQDTAITTHDPLWVLDRMRSNLREDGSLLHFIDEYELRCEYPKFYLKSHVGSFKTDLELTSTNVISWTGSSEMYRHFSLVCTYEGIIECEDEITPVIAELRDINEGAKRFGKRVRFEVS